MTRAHGWNPLRTGPAACWSRAVTAFLFGTVLAATGCAGRETEIGNTVRAYNQLKLEAFVSGNPEVVSLFATPAERKRISATIAYFEAGDRVFSPELVDLTIEAVDVAASGQEARVRTREQWSSLFLDRVTRRPVSAREHREVSRVYRLVLENGKWYVDAVEAP